MIEFFAVGGYNESGKNMSAIKIDDDIIIFDMGFYLQKIVDFEEEGGNRQDLTSNQLIKLEAIPNDHFLFHLKDKVKAICLSHCHLDHIGAVPYLAGKYENACVLGTPFTIEVLTRMMKDDNLKINNDIKTLNPGSKIKINNNIEIEFINVTHSTLQAVIIAVHTKKGTVLYANDFKFDNNPIVGKKPNYERLKELGKENVIALVCDSLYSSSEGKTPSEKVAREMLKDVLLGVDNSKNAIIVTTFASHIARLKSIVDFGGELNRKVVFLGRSLMKYVKAAENLKLVNFSHVDIVGYGDKVKKRISRLNKEDLSKYLIVVTGNQGEPRSVLNKMAQGVLPFKFKREDSIIFSCKTIPVEPNLLNRAALERRLREKGLRIFTDIHASGHCKREDLRDLIKMTNPKHIIPAHGDKTKLMPLSLLAEEMGYKSGKSVHIMDDGKYIKLE